jgi:hypothetical protein
MSRYWRCSPRGSLFKNEKSVPGNQHQVLGEAGGEPPGNRHERTYIELAAKVLRPPSLPPSA